jgi:hypothetical protein
MKSRFTQILAVVALFLFTARVGFAAPAKPAAHATDAHAPATHPAGAGTSEPADDKAAVPDAADELAKPKGPTAMKVGIMLNKLNKFEMGPGSYSAELYITFKCDHEPCKPDFDVTNGKITGKDKVVDDKLIKEFKVKAELEAFVDLAEFPFDKHVLYLGLIDKNPHLNIYEFDSSTNGMDDGVKLAGWDINPKFETNTEKVKLGDGVEVSELQFGLEISRPRTAAVFKSLVPVFFMVFVAGFTLLLKPKSAAGRLSTATGGLMSVVMFHLSASSSLPPLGYLTRLDKFMIATYLVYMANIAFSVAMVRFEEKKNEKMSELMYLVAGGAVPGVALLAWLTVFLKIA